MTGDDVSIDPDQIHTARLILRAWSPDDAAEALQTYGNTEVTRWLVPIIDRVPDVGTMQDLLVAWIGDSYSRRFPEGRWAVERRDDGAVIGGAELLPIGKPGRMFMGWQLCPTAWGHGFASEVGHALAHQAFELDVVDEIFAVTHPRNRRGRATALRIGMSSVGETSAVGAVTLELFRFRRDDLDPLLPGVSFTVGSNPVGLDDW